METKDYLRILREEIHSTVIATVDKDGRPVTRVIDIMLTDENSLYFITAKGKAFYAQLMENPYVAISGMCGGEGTMNKKAVSIRGKAVNIGSARLKEVFQKNPYMAEIYPQGSAEKEDGSAAGEAGQTRQGREKAPGNATGQQGGYFITDRCHGCRICCSRCPQKCIDMSAKPFVIQQEHCLHCGNCMEVCPFGAVERR